ncbi:ABC transporter permease [Asanoa sp. WMMD1127]|uniref:ABC transporter permease n=1 Tax=Asanoa sp. WMMD1127 TaxID=3016107 RepID=UPI0024177B5C|nr:ABC transporter permease [Asanoa sp. WMMD1127]MDG4820793.1 ABC transporter permease [Asanoa sp. WMMD1127]
MTTLGWTVHDSAVVAQRQLRRIVRVPQSLFFSLIQPVLFVLLFTFVLGSAIAVPGGRYIDFLLPGTFVQTVAFAGAATAVGLADESRNGFMDRFRSLPMSHAAVLLGRIAADAVRNLIVVLILLLLGTALGFRLGTGPLEVLGGLGVLVAFSLGFSSLAAAIGLSVGNPEVAQLAMTICAFPLVFASSAYVPMDTLPDWLRIWTQFSPITVTVESIRSLLVGPDAGGPGAARLAPLALLWAALLVVVFLPIAVRAFRRRSDR